MLRVGRWAMLALACLFGSVTAGGPARAAAQEPSAEMSAAARAHYDAGMAHFAARAFAAAAQAFRAAYALDPRREILFAEAQATRLGGDCPAAERLYESFLATNPPPQQVEATRLALARCRAAVTAAPLPAAAPEPAPVAPSTRKADLPPPPPPPPSRWWRDRTGQALAAAGVVAAGVAFGYGVAAARADDDARAAVTYDLYRDRRRVAEERGRWAGRVAIGASLLGAAAAARFVWIGVTPAAVEVAWGGRF